MICIMKRNCLVLLTAICLSLFTGGMVFAAGSISGTVFQSDGSTPVMGGGSVGVYSGDPCGVTSYLFATGYMDNTTGVYEIADIPTGTYYLQANPWGNYVPEWWASTSSVFECTAAEAIYVPDGVSVTGTDFELDVGAGISGTLYDNVGNPIMGQYISVNAYMDNPCNNPTNVAGVMMDANTGTYSINNLPSGSFYLQTVNNGAPFLDEWWADPLSVLECTGAQSITVAVGEVVTDKSFQLDSVATISGTVNESDGSTPITGGGYVEVFTGDPCGSYSWVTDTSISSTDGAYTVDHLQAGTYFLKASPYGNYFAEWWADPLSVTDCSGAQSISVTGGGSVTGKNFQLDASATISGTVYGSDGITQITGGGYVTAYIGDPCSPVWVNSFSIDSSNGAYTITGLSTGEYYLQAYPSGNYLSEWWASPTSVTSCTGAQPIAITAGGTLTGKNFQLDSGGTISGTVFQSDGSTPIAGGGWIDVYTGDPCSPNWGNSFPINDTNGTYTITGLPAGSYYLQAYPSGSYLAEWWASPTSVTACTGAQPIAVTAGGTLTGKNFQLDSGATIFGTVYQSDGSTPTTGGGSVRAYTGDPCGLYSSVAYGPINSANGTYTITNLPAGSYYLQAYPSGNFIAEWWASPTSVTSCTGALSIAVTAGGTVTGKDFELDTGGTISGTVYQSDGTTPITEGGYVSVYTGDPCGWYSPIPGATINSTNGAYTVTGLPAGTYYLKAEPFGNYLEEWWASPTSVTSCTGAQFIAVTTGGTATGKNFQLDSGGTISGTVYQSDGSTPATGGGSVQAYTGDPCSPYWSRSFSINSTNGTYAITGLPAGTYYLKAEPAGNYLEEWWASPTSVTSCSGAQSIAVTTGSTATGKNFQLDSGGTISGTVYQSDGSTPIAGGGWIDVYTGDPCWSYSSVAYGSIHSTNGTYTITGLPAGSYYLVAGPSENYVKEWWASPSSATSCSGAQSIAVTAGGTVTGKDFQLDSGATISGTVFQSDGSTPIAGGGWIDVYSGDPCGSYSSVTNGSINSTNGTYTINGLPDGGYYLRAYTFENYVKEWWASPSSVIGCTNAQSVIVMAGGTTTGVNFQLDVGATISGTVYQSDGITPITGGSFFGAGGVSVYSGDPCGSFAEVANGTIGYLNGTYKIEGIPPGTYYLKAHPSSSEYVAEWWATPLSVVACAGAQTVTVTAGGALTGKNFQLNRVILPGEYYVDIVNGDNANDGSAANPWMHIHFGVEQINGGLSSIAERHAAAGDYGSGETEGGKYILNVAAGTYKVSNVPNEGEPDMPLILSQNGVTIFGADKMNTIIDGTGAANWTKGLEITGSNNVVRNLSITGFFDSDSAGDTEGIRISGGTTNEVTGCRVYRNNFGVRISNSTDSKVQGCEIFQNSTHGMDIIFSSGTNVVENKIYGNPQYGIRVESSPNTNISRNMIYDNWYGILVEALNEDVASPLIENNVIYGTGSGTMNYGIYMRSENYSSVYAKIYHNTIDNGTDTGIGIEVVDGTSSAEPSILYNIVSNCGGFGIENSGGTPFIDYNDVWNNGDGTKASNYSGCEPGTNDLYQGDGIGKNPLYGNSYQLQSTSPCRDAILPDAGDPVTIDYPGYSRPQGNGWDMGAYEYIGPDDFYYTPHVGNEFSDYRIFTVPLKMRTGADLLSNMMLYNPLLFPYNPSSWRAFLFKGGENIEFNDDRFPLLPVGPGVAFWIITLRPDTIRFQGEPAPTNMPYEIVLPPGWSLIGLPWINTPIDLDNIKVTDGVNTYSITDPPPSGNDLTQTCVWDYTGIGPDSGYEKLLAGSTLQCGVGYFINVLVNRNVTIIIPPTNTSGDMVMSSTDAELQGMERRNDDTPPPPPGGAEEFTPVPDIKANGQDGPVDIALGEPVSITITLDPGEQKGRNADWWVLLHTSNAPPSDWYSYVFRSEWQPGIHLAAQAPLFMLRRPFEILDDVLPSGDYVFYFGVDDNADGRVDGTSYDSVEVRVQ